MNTAYLLLGSNEGDREKWLSDAMSKISEQCGQITSRSSIYITAAWGIEEQPDFLNMAIAVETELSATALMESCLSVEKELGRERKLKWGQRTIDIDILYYNNDVINEKNLIIPHPYIHERLFALIPLADIAPDHTHPIFHKNTVEMIDACNDSLAVHKFQ